MASIENIDRNTGLNWTLFYRVAFGHALVLLFAFTLFQLQACRHKKTQFIKAKLVTLPAPDIGDLNQISAQQHPRKKVTPPRKKTKKPTVKKKTRKSPSTKKNNYRTPEQIRKSELVPIEKKSPTIDTSSTTVKKIDVHDLQNRLARKIDAHDAANTTSSYDLQWEKDYLQLLMNQIYQQWRQPSKAEVGDPHLRVKIRLEISRSGLIAGKQLMQTSNNLAMDNSVKRLLSQLNRFPPFPEKMTTNSITKTIVLKLTD